MIYFRLLFWCCFLSDRTFPHRTLQHLCFSLYTLSNAGSSRCYGQPFTYE